MNNTFKFNCGKMTHIFKTQNSSSEIDDDESKEKKYYPLFNDDSLDFLKGILSGETKVYTKINGSCGMIKRKNNIWTLYQRYDKTIKMNKDKKEKTIYSNEDALSDGLTLLSQYNETGNPARYGTNISHNYFLREIPRPNCDVETLKPQELINYSVYKILDSKEFSELKEDEYSVEIVGNNFNKTPGVYWNNIAVHSDQETKLDDFETKALEPEVCLEYFRNYFSKNNVEGLVFIKNNVAKKMLSCNFGFDSEFQKPILRLVHDSTIPIPKGKKNKK